MDTVFETGIISLKTPLANVLAVIRKDLPKSKNQQQIDPAFLQDFEQFLIGLIEDIFDVQKSFVYLESEKD